MTPWDRILGGALWGAGLGAVAVSALAVLWWSVFAPDGLKDGQFVLIFYLFTIPFGALLGVVAGAAAVLLQCQARETAGWICLGGGGLVAVLAVLSALLWWRGKGWFGLAHPMYGAPLAWAAVEMLFGLAQLWRR